MTVYKNKDTGFKAIIVKKTKDKLYMEYVTGIYKGSIFPIYSDLLYKFWDKEVIK